MKINYKAVIDILEQFLNNDKTEILGISVGEEYQLREAIKNLINRNKELEEQNKKYIVQLTDEQYRKLVECIRKDRRTNKSMSM